MTYSQGVTGAPAENPYRPASLRISDSVATTGAQQNAMAQNTPFLAMGPDGQQAWYVYDTERCLPGVTRILRRVGP